VVMSKTVRINPLLVFIAVLTGASLGSLSGGFVAALLAIPTAGALQVLLKEVWQATAPDQPQESPAPAAEPADGHGNPVTQHRPHPTVTTSSSSIPAAPAARPRSPRSPTTSLPV
jgi:hypothetical protein